MTDSENNFYITFQRKAKLSILNGNCDAYSRTLEFINDFKKNSVLEEVCDEKSFHYTSIEFRCFYENKKFLTFLKNKYHKIFSYDIKYEFFREYISEDVILDIQKANGESYKHCEWLFIYTFLTELMFNHNDIRIKLNGI